MERAPTMAFAAGQTVFPGGSVDPGDGGSAYGDRIEDAGQWAAAPGFAPHAGRALLAAAAREVFEEAGVLLADGAFDPETLGRLRIELLAKTVDFASVLEQVDAMLATHLLVPWSRWITPYWSDRRYDTYFFAAKVPEGQTASDGSGEAASTAWRTPSEALELNAGGHSAMFTPTVETLDELAVHDSVDAILTTDSQELGASTFDLHHNPDHVDVVVQRPTSRRVLIELW